jgi:Phage-integrase repeat unit
LGSKRTWRTGQAKRKSHGYLSFKSARKYLREIKFKSQTEYREWIKREDSPTGFPSSPNRVYKDEGWVSWGDYLGNGNFGKRGRKFLPFARARAYARSLQLQGWREWKAWSAAGKRPENVPVNPDEIYPDQWVSVADWLGYVGRFDRARFISQKRPAERTLLRRSTKKKGKKARK